MNREFNTNTLLSIWYRGVSPSDAPIGNVSIEFPENAGQMPHLSDEDGTLCILDGDTVQTETDMEELLRYAANSGYETEKINRLSYWLSKIFDIKRFSKISGREIIWQAVSDAHFFNVRGDIYV